MANRPQGTRSAVGKNADLLVKGTAGVLTPGVLYSLHISTDGATAGDRIALFDARNAGECTDATKLVEVLIPGADNNIPVPLPAVGIQFTKGLFYNPQVTGGEVRSTIGYD